MILYGLLIKSLCQIFSSYLQNSLYKHFSKNNRNLNEPSVVDSSDAKTTEKDKKGTLLRENVQKITHEIEVLTNK